MDDRAPLIALTSALDPLGRAAEADARREAWLAVDPSLKNDPEKIVLVLARLRRFFGGETLSRALALWMLSKTPARKVSAQFSLDDFKPPA